MLPHVPLASCQHLLGMQAEVSVHLCACLQERGEKDDDFEWDTFNVELSLLFASAGETNEGILNMSDDDVVKHAGVIEKDRSITGTKVRNFVDKWAGELAGQLTTKRARIAWCLAKLVEGSKL